MFTHGNVPEQETQDWLAGIKQFQENWLLRGDVDKTKVQNLARLGITDALNTSAEEMMQPAGGAVLWRGPRDRYQPGRIGRAIADAKPGIAQRWREPAGRR